VTPDIAIVFAILLSAVVLFVSERVRVDVVALMVLVSLAITGLLTPEQAVSGFSNPAVVTVWAVFILSGGLARTGVAGILGRYVLRLAGASEARLVLVIMLTAASLSAFMNNVGVAALLLPVVMDISRRTGRAPSKLLIPLAFSSLLGGLLTLIGTPPNILVSATLAGAGFRPFTLFDFVPAGAPVVLAGIAYMSLVGRRLLPSRNPGREMAGDDAELEQAYGLSDRLLALDVPEGSPLAGKTLRESRLGSALDLSVLAIHRAGRRHLAPDSETVLQPGDRVLVQGPEGAAEEIGATRYLDLGSESVAIEELISDEVGLAEVTPAPRSGLLGKTLREIDFRHRFHGCLVLSVWRDGAPLRTHLAVTRLTAGDVLLVHGTHDALRQIEESPELVVSPIFDPLVYQIEERLMSCTVPEVSALVGKTLAESRLGDVFSLGIMGIIRDGKKQLIPPPDERLEAGDRLLVKGRPADLIAVEGIHDLRVEPTRVEAAEDLESAEICLAELVLSPRSGAAGKTLAELSFREKYGFNVLAVTRRGQVIRSLRHVPLELGDALLIHGPRQKLKPLAGDRDFLILTEEAQEPPLKAKAPIAVLIMLGVVGSVILELVPIYIAGVSGAVLMVLTGCLNMDEAYSAIEWRAVFLIAGMLPLGLALQESGGVELLALGVVGTVGDMGPLWVVGALYVLTALCAQVMPTSAVAILIAPVALGTAAELGLSPHALMMTVALSASASFMSPVAHPANVLIMGPGGYRFIDYIKVGLPLTVICLIVTLLVLPLVWPLTL